MKKIRIYLDFDGTMVEHVFPGMGRENPGAVRVVRRLIEAGHEVVLNAYRADISAEAFNSARAFMRKKLEAGPGEDMAFCGLKVDPQPWFPARAFNTGIMFIDDRAFGTPLVPAVMSAGMMVDWTEAEVQMEMAGILPRLVELEYVCCTVTRYLVCLPYSVDNLHRTARELGVPRGWFRGDHYDIPPGRLKDVMPRCSNVEPHRIEAIIRHGKTKGEQHGSM